MLRFLKIFTILVCVPVPAAFSAETVSASGFYELEIDDEVSPHEAMDRAFAEAKKDALQKVVGVEVKSWEALVLDSAAGEGFSSLTLQTSRGLIRKFDVKRRGWEILKTPARPDGVLRVFCDADVRVEKIDDKPDLEFSGKIVGALADYRDGDRAIFSVAATKEAYLTVFLLDARLGGAKVFPNRTYRKNKLSAEEPFELPSFTIRKTLPGAAREQGVLMFVLTKKNIPFLAPASGKVSADEINAWLADIPARERFFRVFPFSVAAEGVELP